MKEGQVTNDQEAEEAGRVFGRANAKNFAEHDDYYVESVESEDGVYKQFRESRWEYVKQHLDISKNVKAAFIKGWIYGAVRYARENGFGLKRTEDDDKCKRCARPFGDGAGMIRVERHPGDGLAGGLIMIPCNKCNK